MATIDLTKENFEKTVNENPMVIVDFWAPWCGPCKGFAPVYEQASEAYPGVVFAKVNTDEQQELAGACSSRRAHCLGRRSIRWLRRPSRST